MNEVKDNKRLPALTVVPNFNASYSRGKACFCTALQTISIANDSSAEEIVLAGARDRLFLENLMQYAMIRTILLKLEYLFNS